MITFCSETTKCNLTLWRLAAFGDFHKKHQNARGFAQEFLWSSKCYWPVKSLTLWHSAAFGDFWKKTPKRTWLCAGISPLLYGLQTWSKRQKTRQAPEKNFVVWGCGFFVSDIISGGLLGHLGPLCLALGINR